MVPLCCIYTAQRSRRQYVLVETSTFPLYWVKHEPSSTDISKYFYKRNNNKKRLLYRTEPIFPVLTGLFQVCAKQKCSSVSHWFDTLFWQYTCQNICDSFFLNWRCFNVCLFVFFFFFCKLRQTNFRHWCFEKEELFFVSWLYFWYE